MAKLTRDCDPPERMLRALLVLDGLALMSDDFHNVSLRTLERFVADVYTIAHAATGTCGNSHGDWLDLIDERAQLLKERHIMDVDKMVQQLADGELPRKHNANGLLATLKESNGGSEETTTSR